MSLTIATWNVQNFAVPVAASMALFGHKLDAIVAALVAIDADLIALQELLDEQVAARIATALNRALGAEAYSAVNGQPDRRHNRVGFISRLPIVTAETESLTAWQLPPGSSVLRLDRMAGKIVTVPEATLPRPPLRLRVRLVDGTTVDVINAHLKSRTLRYPGGGLSTHDAALRAQAAQLALERRTAEAMCVRARVDALRAVGRRVIVLGDLNDGPDAATTQILYGLDRDAGQRLVNITTLIPADQRWSRKQDGQGQMLDQILVSQGLTPRHVQVQHDHVLRAVSDHALVYATLTALE
jgi:endonuclease/exonuclease/phosphatase family metal-dependent hydrolase